MVHDPVVAKQGGTYYLFGTGGGHPGTPGVIPVLTSSDLCTWSRSHFALEGLPAWTRDEVPKARNAWAPDIVRVGEEWRLYYSVSSFGVNHSAIGLAVNRTLDPRSPEHRWEDRGVVVRSRPGETDYNAIDPNVAIDADGGQWLTWGSFWGGIMLQRLDPRTGKPAGGDNPVRPIARRPRGAAHQRPPADGAIEAPFLVQRGGYWWLFASFDYCCRGAESDYKVVVGRADRVTGPYADRSGRPMLDGGGTLILEAATDAWRGAGHPAVYREGGEDYLLFHAYAASDGKARLGISTIDWAEGWPRVATLP